MSHQRDHSIVLFDGVCNFCNSSVNFIIRKDRNDQFRFVALQSDKGMDITGKLNVNAVGLKTVILLENGRVYTKSTAALRIARKLTGGWPLFYGFIIVPAFLRDLVYNFISANRYRIWGKRESCMVPGPEVRRKFL